MILSIDVSMPFKLNLNPMVRDFSFENMLKISAILTIEYHWCFSKIILKYVKFEGINVYSVLKLAFSTQQGECDNLRTDSKLRMVFDGIF